MKFLADENFPGQSIDLLRQHEIDISSIQEIDSGISDKEVLHIAITENRTLLTLDRDFGSLIFKLDIRPKAGVVFFRLPDFKPTDLFKMLMELIEREETFENSLIVIDKNSVRKRKY